MPYRFDGSSGQAEPRPFQPQKKLEGQRNPTGTERPQTAVAYPGMNSDHREEVLYGVDIQKTHQYGGKRTFSGDLEFVSPTGESFVLDADTQSKHLLLLGGIGTGKTNVFKQIIAQKLHDGLSDEDVMLIFDAKGDFYEDFFDRTNPRHALIGNAERFHWVTHHWNLFAELDDYDLLGDPARRAKQEMEAKEIARQLFRDRKSESQPFFPLAAADLLGKVICDFLRDVSRKGKHSHLCNAELIRYLSRAGVEQYRELTSAERNPDFTNARMYFDTGEEKTPKLTTQGLGVFGYISSVVNDLFVGVFGDGTAGDPFSLRSAVRERGGRVVFVEYDLQAGEVLGPIYRLLFDMALKEALGQREGRRGNVYLVVDEFKLLPNLQHIDDALNFGRSLGVKVFAGIQNVSQIYDIYGEDRGRSMLAGFMNTFCFYTPDYETRAFISERYGKNYRNIRLQSGVDPVYVQREGNNVEDWHLLNLGLGDAVVRLRSGAPFRFHFSSFDVPAAGAR